MGVKLSSPKLAIVLRALLWVVLALGLTISFRLDKWSATFHDGGVYFTDGDCYSRMTRARMVFNGEAFSIRWHAFENHPQGTSPHTTAPLDWLIAGFAWLLKPFSAGALDYAGAWIGPLLAAAAVGVLLWALWGQPGAWMAVILFAVSPILVHGNAIGRPDHQALQIFLLTAFLGFRWRAFADQPNRSESILAGAALGLALWVSLYEPAILAALFLILELLFNRKRLLVRERLWELGVLLAVTLLAIAIDGVRWSPPAGELFSRWSQQIGELRTLKWHEPAAWIGWAGYAAFLGAVWLAVRRKDFRLAAWACAWLVLLVLTCLQMRWGYFLALGTVFLVTGGFNWIPASWGRGIVFAILLFPIWLYWSAAWKPDPSRQEHLAEQRKDEVLTRETAHFLKQNAKPGEGVLAPWWLCPPIAYWSGLPCVAGSSHQSLPGIEAAARFYLEQDATVARRILDERKVDWIVAYEPERIYSTATFLIQKPGLPSSMAGILYQRTNLAPRFLRLAYVNDFFKLYRVNPQ